VTVLETTSRSFVAVVVEEAATRIKRVDTVFITTTDITAPRRLASLVLQRTVGDTVKLPVDSTRRLTFIAMDSTGRRFTISQLPVWFQIRNSSVATISRENGDMLPAAPNRSTTVLASVTYYGITLKDSIQLYIGYPMVMAYSKGVFDGIHSAKTLFGENARTIGVGGTLVFQASLIIRSDGPNGMPMVIGSTPYEVIFDNPDAAKESELSSWEGFQIPRERGNVASLSVQAMPFVEFLAICMQGSARCLAARSFHTPGTYTFHDPHSGDTGRIIVK
jgi:hypothetical protein